MSNEFWDERYGGEELAYGAAANEFLVSVVAGLERGAPSPRPSPIGRGSALDIGAGEGRNALYLASLGFDVLAVDQSAVGMEKAQRLARQRGLALRTQAVDLAEWVGEPEGRGGQSAEGGGQPPFTPKTAQKGTVPGEASFDLVSSIFVHLPGALRAGVHRRVGQWLKPGGLFVLEAYAPDQIGRGTGGPREPELLASLDTTVGELAGLVIEHQAALVREVREGRFHTGEASVVQVVARKA